MSKRQARNLTVIAISVLLLTSGFNNCGQRTRVSLREATLLSTGSFALGGTSGGNPARTSLKFGPYQNPLPVGSNIPTISLGIAEFSICISELDFISVDGSEVTQSFDRELQLAEDGTPISDVTIPPGEYSQVVVVVENACHTDRSLLVTNRSGGLASIARAKMVFNGPFNADGHDVTLDIVSIALSMADSMSEQSALDSLSQGGSATASIGTGN